MQEIIRPLLNEICDKVKKVDSKIIMEFGQKGNLTIETSYWYLKQEGRLVAHGVSLEKDIEEGIKVLEDKRILEVINLEGITIFKFEGEVDLEVNKDPDNEEWILITEDNKALTMGPNHRWTYNHVDK